MPAYTMMMRLVIKPIWMVMIIFMAVVISSRRRRVGAQLSGNFYSSTCSNLETVVLQSVTNKVAQTGNTVPIAATLRLFFHDCFVQQGCDASILIFSPNGDAEKDAPDNLSLAGDGFDTVIKAKQAVEAQCPGVVSCADILAIATRCVIGLAGGPSFGVELGRRDGLVSKASLVAGNLPEPTDNVNQLTALFANNNLTSTDMIALSAAHTIGFSHCTRFLNRLYNFSSSNPTDPSLNPNYASLLMQTCPQNVDSTIVVDLDPTTPFVFDNAYYQNLVGGKGLLTSDQQLFEDPSTQPTVARWATDSSAFNAAFISAITQLGRTGVKTGNQGEIRKVCNAFNS